MDSNIFATILSAVLPLAGTDETRSYLYGIVVRVYNGDPVVDATDGHRLARVTLYNSGEHALNTWGADPIRILPREVTQLVALAKTVRNTGPRVDKKLTHGRIMRTDTETGHRFDACHGTTGAVVGSVVIPRRTNAGEAPPFERVIPQYKAKRETERFGINACYLAEASACACALTGQKDGGMTLDVGGPLDPIRIGVTKMIDPTIVDVAIVVMPMRI